MGDPRQALLDDLLVLACREGRPEAFRSLLSRWQEPLWRHAYRLTGREDAAWDVLQEVWIAVAEGIGRLREPRGFRAWVYTVTTRRAADWLRANGGGAELAPETEAPAAEEPATAVEALRAALRRLPRERRALLTLRYLDGLSLEEIAEVLGVPVGTVKSRLHQARSELRQEIERLER